MYSFGTDNNLSQACKAYNVHEWQTHAMSNRKIDAIKAVRASTGFGLKEAKDVVELWMDRGCILSTRTTWAVPNNSGNGERRQVVENFDGTFSIEVSRTIYCRDIGELIRNIANL